MNRPTLSILVLTAVPLVGCASTAKHDLAQNPNHEAQGVRHQEIGYCGCSLFDLPDILRYQVLETNYWLVVLNPFDQLYLGRSVIILKRHAPTLANVTDAEWVDYKQLVGVFATAISRAFDAEHFNWSFNMNHAFRKDPPQLHVHGHVRPRYRVPVTFVGLTFEDQEFGNHYDLKKRKVEPAVLDAICDKLVHALRKTSDIH